MLKTRIISSIVGLLLLVLAVWSDQIILGIAIFILAVIGIDEFYNAVANAGYKPIKFIGYVSCTPILFIGMNGVFKRITSYIELFKSINYFSFWLYIIVLVLFFIIIFTSNKYNIIDIALTIFGALYVAFLFAFIVLTRNLDYGFYYIWLIFIGAFATDTFAFFTGLPLGKHKFLPAISPKKSIEGSIGGILGCVAVTVLYGILINRFIPHIQLHHYVILGILNGIISQIGDWSASAIKRYVKVKDYGKIMPGHGGVLDRFDSILFIGPVVYFYISFIILK